MKKKWNIKEEKLNIKEKTFVRCSYIKYDSINCEECFCGEVDDLVMIFSFGNAYLERNGFRNKEKEQLTNRIELFSTNVLLLDKSLSITRGCPITDDLQLVFLTE